MSGEYVAGVAREAAFVAWWNETPVLTLSHDWAVGYWRAGWESYPGRSRPPRADYPRGFYRAGRRAARAYRKAAQS